MPSTPPLGDILDRLPAIFDNVADGVTVLDRTGTIRFANAIAAQLMGRDTAADVIGRSAAELTGSFELLDAGGGELDVSRLPTHRAFAGEERPEEVVRFRRRGTVNDQWSLVRARLLPGATSDDDLVVTSFQDVTSLKRSEARFGFLAEASSILSEFTDYEVTLNRVAQLAVPFLADWCVVDVVATAGDVHRVAVMHADPDKLALAEEMQGRWPPAADRPTALQQVMAARAPIHVPSLGEEQLRAAAHDDEHLAALRQLALRSVLIVPLVARGEILGALTLASETDRQLEADDLAVAEELGRRAGLAIDAARLVWEGERSTQTRDELIAVASHDMRTPLAAVRGYAQLARRHLAGDAIDVEALDRWLRDIDAGVERLARLVSEFMDASLVRGGQPVPLQAERMDLRKLIDELAERYRRSAEHHVVEVDGTHSIVGVWDEARLARVLENVLDNAVKFSPDGGRITVTATTSDGQAWVAISDEGIGVAPGDRERIFDPMYRGRNARRVTGSGLGLAGSRRLIEQMGGGISVGSELAKGSTFTIRLPMQGNATV